MRAVRTTWFITARSATTGALRLVLRLLGLASFLALDGLHHRRRAGVGLLLLHRQVAQHGVVEAEGVLELTHHVLVGLDVDAQVVRLGELVDLVGQLAAAPVLDTMHLAAAGGDHALVTLQHGRNLFALVRVDQQHDFIMTHGLSLRMGRRSFSKLPAVAAAPGVKTGCGKAKPEIIQRAARRACRVRQLAARADRASAASGTAARPPRVSAWPAG